MRKFKWFLNWSVGGIYTNDGDVLPVWNNGKNIGTCTITIEGKEIVGDFDLTEDLDGDQYVLYAHSVPDQTGQAWLEGIMLVRYYSGLEKRARKASDMAN